MPDIADKSENAVLRPGINFQWLVVGPDPETLWKHAATPGTFGESIRYSVEEVGCCGVLFTAESDGGILFWDYNRIAYFFERDGAEALVFEFDRWQKKFFARRRQELCNRRK